MFVTTILAGAMMTQCTLLDDFSDGDTALWRVVNDGVMGGKSEGGVEASEGQLIFAGSINTDGGGFSSVRRRLSPGDLADAEALRMTVKGDGRAYEMIFQTDATYRGLRITYRSPLTSALHEDAQEVMVSLDDMATSIFGRSVPAPPFDASTAVELGIILSDGQDGPFRLDVEKIEVCR